MDGNHIRRRLAHYLAGAVLVRVADEGARVCLVLLALQRTHSAAIGAGLVAALLVPHVVAAPVVGLLADRARRPARVVAVAALGFAAALACVVAGLGRVPIPAILAVLLAGGACGPALTGALTSQLPALVPERALPRAFGLDSLSYNVAGIAGPAVAGLLSGFASPGVATMALAGSAAGGAALLAGLPVRRGAPAGDGAHPPLRAGFVALARNRVLGIVTFSSSLGQLGPGALPVVAAVIADRAQEPAAGGYLMTAVAAGGLLGSLMWTWRPVRRDRAPLTAMLALIGVGAPLVLAAASPSPVLTALLFAASGVFLGPFAGALFTARQDHAPEAVRAQVFTLGAGLKTTAAATGAALAGTVSAAATATQLVLVAACPLLAGALGAALLARRGRRTPTARPVAHARTV